MKAASRPRTAPRDEIARWTTVWLALLCLAVPVVAGALTIITNSLTRIDDSLGVVSQSFRGVDGNTATLSGRVDSINSTLARIDVALTPLPGLVEGVITSLTSLDATLAVTDASMKQTSIVLEAVLSSFDGANTDLFEVGGDGLPRVSGSISTFNADLLTGIASDLSTTIKSVVGANQSLQRICGSTTISGLSVVAALARGAGRGC